MSIGRLADRWSFIERHMFKYMETLVWDSVEEIVHTTSMLSTKAKETAGTDKIVRKETRFIRRAGNGPGFAFRLDDREPDTCIEEYIDEDGAVHAIRYVRLENIEKEYNRLSKEFS